MKWLCSLLFALSLHAQSLQLVDHYDTQPPYRYSFQDCPASNADLATFQFDWHYQAFVLWTNDVPVDLTGATLYALLTIDAETNTTWRYPGEDTWNPPAYPPCARFFIGTKVGYSNLDPEITAYWWTTNVWLIPTNGGTVLMVQEPNVAQWGDGGGEVNPPLFQQALTNVMEFGLSYSGGAFWDLGLESNNAIFHLTDFQIFRPSPSPIGEKPVRSINDQ